MSAHETRNPPKVAVANLAPAHYAALVRALFKILSTRLAVGTFAQIVDGRPIRGVYQEHYNEYRRDFHTNLDPSQTALEAVESYRRSLSIDPLEVDPNVVSIAHHIL